MNGGRITHQEINAANLKSGFEKRGHAGSNMGWVLPGGDVPIARHVKAPPLDSCHMVLKSSVRVHQSAKQPATRDFRLILGEILSSNQASGNCTFDSSICDRRMNPFAIIMRNVEFEGD